MTRNDMKISLELCENSQLPNEFRDRSYIRVYLASALTGREEDKELDDIVRSAIKEVFSSAELQKIPFLLKYQVYDPAEHTQPGSSHSAEEVYRIDFKELVDSDMAFFYVNAPSLGVGIERQIAASGNVIAGIAHQSNEKISRMFNGVFSGSLFNITFETVEELKHKLSHEIAKLGTNILVSSQRRRKAIMAMRDCKIGSVIFKKRVSMNIAIADLSKEIGVEVFWWKELERDTIGCIAGVTLTPVIFQLLGEVLEGEWSLNLNGTPCFNPKINVNEVQNKSLDNLYDAYITREKITEDSIILCVWKNYVEASVKDKNPLLTSSCCGKRKFHDLIFA